MANKIVCLIALFIATCMCAAIVSATQGVDVSGACLVSNWQCLAKGGYSFGIVRALRSNGSPDTNAPHTVYNAWDGGMKHVDVYFFPCYKCGNAAGQVKSAVDYLKSYNAKWGTTWLDIEGTQYWSSSQSSNQQFFEEMVSELKSLGQTIGVYTSASQWDPIMGSSYTGGSRYPLWYAHYDGRQSFSDFSPFGGWKRPAMKQYAGDDSDCGCGVDLNWY